MNGEVANDSEPFDVSDDIETDDEVGLSFVSDDEDFDDNIGDISVEINVDELIAKIEAKNGGESQRRREVRRRLEELRERRDAEKDIDITFNLNFDDER